jgi:lipopolysaccharide heptosyltransferase II
MVKSTLEVYREALGNFKLLIIKLSSLGDIILSTAAIRAIKEKFGKTHSISFLVGAESKDVLLRCPYIDELLVCDAKEKGLAGILRLSTVLRKKNFDIVIDLQNNRKSHMLALFSLALHRYGYDKKLGFLLNHRVKDDSPPMDPVSHQFRVLKMLGIEMGDVRLELWPSQDDQRYIDELLALQWTSAHQKIVGINMSASLRWRTKNWPLKHIVDFCEKLAHSDIRIVITGTENDLAAAQALISRVKDAKPISTCGKTSINQLACLIKRCNVFISADSAPLHIAASVGTPFVALFGPTDPRRHLPPAKNYAVINKDLSCGPCYKPECKTIKCMEEITAQEVLQAVDRLLGASAEK